MIDKLEDIAIGWPILGPLIGFVFWLSGVHYRTVQNGAAIRKEREDRQALEARIATQRLEDKRDHEADQQEVRDSLKVIHEDIKKLLTRH